METFDNVMIYIWLIPVIGLIVIPLLWSLFVKLYKTIERSRLAKVEGCILENSVADAGTENFEKRCNNRIRLNEGHAYIDELSDCCKADVSNISQNGICLNRVPEAMDLKPTSLMVLFRTPEEDYTFRAKPIWKKLTGNGYVMGAKIDQTPVGWENLLQEFDQTCAVRDARVL